MTSCILTVIKNEHEYLDEWIKYHLDLGIDHIFIFEDIDSDSHKEICDEYENVTLNNINIVLNNDELNKIKDIKSRGIIHHSENPQHIYIKNGIQYLSSLKKYDWCFVIDNDEFITFERKNDKLQDILELYKNYDAFILQWKCYGANGLIHKPDYTNKGIIETYTKEITGYVPAATPQSLTKTCYNLNTYQKSYFLYTHQPSKYCNFCRTNFSKDRNTPVYDKIYIRHYITKSWEEYLWKKKSRGYFFGQLRTDNAFFDINSDMNQYKKTLLHNIDSKILVVLPYKQKGSQGAEIKLSLSAWKKFCQFEYHFIVIGEFNDELIKEFQWVEFIKCPTKEKREGQYNPHIDIINKFNIIYKKYGNAYDGFIYITDDEYAIKPFDFNDIVVTHYHASTFIGNEKQPTWYWNHDKWKTRQLLDKEHLPHINYTTHYPCYFEFKKLNEIWNKFNMLNESYVLEDIYFNYFKHDEPILDSTIRLGIWNKQIFDNEFQNAVNNPNIKFCCNSVEGWSKDLENELQKIIDNT